MFMNLEHVNWLYLHVFTFVYYKEEIALYQSVFVKNHDMYLHSDFWILWSLRWADAFVIGVKLVQTGTDKLRVVYL